MKKILVLILASLLTAGSCFAGTFNGGEKIVETFMAKGTYIKIAYNDNNVIYLTKNVTIHIDEDDIKIGGDSNINLSAKFSDAILTFSVSKYNIGLDENNNLIISKKK